MSANEEPKHDKEGRLLDPDSGKFNCLANYCRPKLKNLPNPTILAVAILKSINNPGVEVSGASIYHKTIDGCRNLLSGDEPPAIRGDFIVQIRFFRGSREVNENEFYVGFPSDFEEEVILERTQLVNGFGARHMLEALKVQAIQHVLKCAVCKEWIDFMVWAEGEDAVEQVPWDLIREKAEYVVEEEETDIEEKEEKPKKETDKFGRGKRGRKDEDEQKDKSSEQYVVWEDPAEVEAEAEDSWESESEDEDQDMIL